MIRGGTPATAAPRIRARGVRPLRFAASSRGDDQRRGAVVDARGIAGGDRAVLADDRLQLGERLEAGHARMLVLVDDHRIALALRDFDRDDLGGEPAVGLRGGGFVLAAQGERVLVLAADLELARRHSRPCSGMVSSP